MKEQTQDETEKYSLFQKEIYKENDFLIKIKDIFNLQYEEKFQDILILQKNKFLEQLEKEVLSILKKLYSEKILSNKKFNSLFQICKEDYENRYSYNYGEISSEWEYFYNLKNNNNVNNEEKINSYYITDFRKHCHNHEGLAEHKCGHAEKGKFVKIFVRYNFRFKKNKEIKYIICEECKKVFLKDLFINYCSYCKEIYLCGILSPNDSKECFMATYTEPHCDTFINKVIPCKLCKEKLYLFINDKKLKCLKCSYVIDLNNKNEFQWQCTKCNKYFKSNVKIYNSSENLILPTVLKKALLYKIKAHPKFINCCNIDLENTSFFHKRDCNGILYLCNIENYCLKNKKWAIVCENCKVINNYNNFIWICPKCGKKFRDTNNGSEEVFTSSQKKNVDSQNNTNNVDKENNDNNNNDIKSNLYRKYLSNHIIKKPSLSPCPMDDDSKNKKVEYDSRTKYSYKKREKIKTNDDIRFNSESGNQLIKVNVKINNNLNSGSNNNSKKDLFSKFYRRAKIYNTDRNNKMVIETNNNNVNSSNASINSNYQFKSSREKYKSKRRYDLLEENNNPINNNNNEKKKMENTIPLPRSNYIKKRNSSIYIATKEEEKNKKQMDMGEKERYTSSNIVDEKEEKIKEDFNQDYFSKINNDNNHNNINLNKKSIIFNFRYKRNIPVRLRYINDKNNNKYNKNKQSLKKSLELEENSKIKEDCEKNEEDINDKKRFLLYSCEDKNGNRDGRISKETTARGTKSSVESTSKEGTNNANNLNVKKYENSNNNSKEKDYFYFSSSFNFRNVRKYYAKEREKEKSSDIKNLKSSIPTPGIHNKFRNKNKNVEVSNFELNVNEVYNKKKRSNKPSDIKEPSEINYSEDIAIYDKKIKQNKELYNNIQNGIKKILEKGQLPQFNIDNYTIEKKIGDGAFGVLFSATNNKTKQKYALKKLTACDLKILEELQKEFEIVYKTNHENILNIYGICIKVYDSTTFALFVLMDLGDCDWEIEINRRFKEKKYYTEEELIKILKQLASALVFLQNKQIAHRDIKPENIILFKENKNVIYKICDFGEAKEKIKVNSRHKSIRGTDYYMSPILYKGLIKEEKFVRDNAYKSDVFSLGICMTIAGILDFNFINKIRNLEEQSKLDTIIRENLEKRYSDKFINIILKMVVYSEKDRIDFLGLEHLINTEL